MSDFGLLDGLLGALSLANLFYALLGCLLGTLIGVLPGLGPAASMAILLPIVIHLPPEASIIIMAGIYYGTMYGGSTTAILMNIPGEVASVVTAIDGFPMTKKGRAGEALAIAAIGSFIAGILGTLAIAWIGPRLADFALSFGAPEQFGLVFFSLTALIGFAGRSLILGLSMGVLGMWLAALGSDPMTGAMRLTYGNVEMMKGIDIVAMSVGIFGIGEVLYSANMRASQIFTGRLPPWYRMFPVGVELSRGLKACLRGTAVGGVLGLIPGMAPALSTYLSYGVEKRLADDPDRFGKGAIEGVASPEAANNATAMAGFIPLFSLGIPTSPALAILLGTLIMNGLQPGPTLFTQHADVAFTVIASMLICNVMLVVLNLPLVGLWSRISVIPYSLLAPIVLAVCLIGAYAPRNALSDVAIAIGFGVFGYVMRRLDWPMAPLVLGFLLGPLFEQSLRQSLGMSDGSLAIFFERPLTLVFIVAAFLVVGVVAWMTHRSAAISRLVQEGSNDV